MNRSRNEQGIFAAAAVALIAVFLPWIKITVPLLGFVGFGSLDGIDGLILIGAIVATVALAWFNRKTGALIAAGVTALLVGYTVIDLVVKVSEANAAGEGMVMSSYQAGLYLAVVAMVALVAFAVLNRKAPVTAPVAADVETPVGDEGR